MDDDPKRTENFVPIFQQIAEKLNQLEPEQREAIRTPLWEYAHDFKHTLGLVTGANAILQRDDDVTEEHGEMLDIIDQAVIKLNNSFELFVQNLANRIKLED
jgi:hypothetical protein